LITLRDILTSTLYVTIQEPGGVLVFLPGQDDIEALESLLEENLPDIVGQQSQEFLGCHDENSSGEVADRKAEPVVRKGILKDFEILPLYAAMPPEEQVQCSSMIQIFLLVSYISYNIASLVGRLRMLCLRGAGVRIRVWILESSYISKQCSNKIITSLALYDSAQ
jgi:hypothetical protein